MTLIRNYCGKSSVDLSHFFPCKLSADSNQFKESSPDDTAALTLGS